jgi:hypothetical protein
VTRMLEACVSKGRFDSVAAIAEQVRWQVRVGLTRPALPATPSAAGGKWRVETAAAAVTNVVLEPHEEPERPELVSA